MFRRVRNLSWCVWLSALGILVPLGGRGAAAEKPAAPELKSQIVRWDDAKAHQGDWGEMRRYFGGQSFATKDVLVAVAVVQPGKAVHKAHRHAEEEYLGLIEGSGVWSLDGKESPAQRGDILYVRPWVYHGLTNTGDTPLIFLVVRYNGKNVPVPPQPDDRPNELSGEPAAGQPAPPATADVRGKITLDGQPLPNATITFVPENGRPVAARTNADGSFAVPAGPGQKLAPGRYRVTITGQDPAAPQADPAKRAPAEAQAKVPVAYGDPNTSQLMVECRPGANELDFALQSR